MGYFYPTLGSGTNGIVGLGDSSNFYALMHRGDIGAINLYNGITLVNGSTSISLNTWYWIGVVVSGIGAGGMNAYLNGGSSAEATHSGNVLVTVKDIYIGTTPGNDQYTGRIGNNYVYDAVLTATEIAQQMRQVVPVRTANLLFWSPFIKVETSDYSGSGNTLTQTGTPTIADGAPVAWSGARRPRRILVAGGGGAPALATRKMLLGVGK